MTHFNEQNYNAELKIVVNTCDSYGDALSLFFAAFNEYWPNCEFQVVINTELDECRNYDVKVQNYVSDDGVDHWGDRLLKTLDRIDSEFVLMIYDDFILEDVVNTDEIRCALDLVKKNKKTAVAYLVNTKLPIEREFLGSMFSEVKNRVDYRLN